MNKVVLGDLENIKLSAGEVRARTEDPDVRVLADQIVYLCLALKDVMPVECEHEPEFRWGWKQTDTLPWRLRAPCKKCSVVMEFEVTAVVAT